MAFKHTATFRWLLFSTSILGAGVIANPALAQSTTSTDAKVDTSGNSEDVVVITGIRRSLRDSIDRKRDGQGVVDAISAEDMGKFPDTNLAESLQRITGVSIDRNSGEGSTVTVRGFGPDYNLVLFNGRQMPASGLGDCCSAPASRSFDFGNLASEGVAAVEVYKSGRAPLPTGGIGSVINILTPRPLDRPGSRGSVGVKAVVDHSFSGTKITPEISGIYSTTFADNKVGIVVNGSYQRRKASIAQFNAGWREGYSGTEANWGSLPTTPNPRIVNRPGANDIYQVTQNASYDFTDIDRERINGQLVLQIKPMDNLTATADYTFSQNTVDARTNSVGLWYNHNNTASSWSGSPIAGTSFYTEDFRANENKDVAFSSAVAANRSINRSLGGNLKWNGLGGLRLELDGHHSTAESKPTTPYGSNIAIGAAIFGVKSQSVDFTSKMPVISVDMYPGSEIGLGNVRPSGNSFRNAYMRDRINEGWLRGGYDFNSPAIKSVDFGVGITDNFIRSAYGFLQNDTWGGTLSAAATPDTLFKMVSVPGRLKGMKRSGAPIVPNYFETDTRGLISLLESQLKICSNPATGAANPGTCLAQYMADRRIQEKTVAAYLQSRHVFDIGSNPSHLNFGLRYENTKVNSSALVPTPVGTAWVGDNEISISYADPQFFTTKGQYHNWLPAVDFDILLPNSVKLRASYSHTITRSNYNDLQGGLTVAQPIRVNGGVGAIGNPSLLPYKSKNIDLSAEWYYTRESYISLGFFHKQVGNYVSRPVYDAPAFGLRNPMAGPRAIAAKAALGNTATPTEIRQWIIANYPAAAGPAKDSVIGLPDDPLVNFQITQPANSDQKAKLWGLEAAIQHRFGESGFGTILNYTLVRSDTKFDNRLPHTVSQFAVTGVSDSANAVAYYDKNGVQARIAYNWRDGFLAGYGQDPYYVRPYGQFDASASLEFGKGLSGFVEAINLTNADRRGHMRSDKAIFFASPGYARYSAGLRATF